MLVPSGTRYCPQHTVPWENYGSSPERSDTAAHRALKRTVLKDARYQCQIHYPDICDRFATQLDRIDNRKGYSRNNCQAACVPCHKRKSSLEGHEAQGHNV